MTIKRFTLTVSVAGALALPAPASAQEVPVSGHWQQLVNCAITSYNPFNEAMRCVGSSLWTGSWRGITTYTVTGTYDLLTGNGSGTIHETLLGSAADGTHGTLVFDERFTLDGAAGRIHIDAAVTGSTGAFAGSRGEATFDGPDNLVTGSGSYAGRWVRP